MKRERIALVVGIGAIVLAVAAIFVLAPKDDPEAREVEAQVERNYRYPQRHRLTRAVENTREVPYVEWARRYDGIDVGSKIISVRGPKGLEVRWHRELAEPEPVRRDAVVSFANAAAAAGVRDAFARGEVKARLLYRPRLKLLPGGGDLVVERYQLVIRIEGLTQTSDVDAYTGALIEHFSHNRS
jgi:hypothetical protein